MINSKRRAIALIALIVGLFLALTAGSAAAAYPEVTTEASTAVTRTSSTLHGLVGTGGYETEWGFELGTVKESEEGAGNGVISSGKFSPVAVSVKVENLQPSTTYYVRLLAYGGGHFTFGNYVTFKTLAPQIPMFEADKYPASIHGEQEVSGTLDLKLSSILGWQHAKCESGDFTGSATGSNSTLPVDAAYGACTFLGESATTNMHSCHYRLELDNTGPPYSGPASIVCAEEGDAIEITGPLCRLTIPAQSLGIAQFSNSGEGSERQIEASISASGVKVNHEVIETCFSVGKTGTLSGSLTLAGEGKNGVFIDGEDTAQVGVFVTGEESEEEVGKPRFTAEAFPRQLMSEQDPEVPVSIFKKGGWNITCASGGWSGDLEAASTEVTLNTSLSGCNLGGEPVTVKLSGCDYVLHADNAGPPYIGSPEISCPAGNAIGISTELCSVTIPPQQLSGGASYAVKGEGSNRAIDVDIAASDLKYFKIGTSCSFFFGGDGEDGEFGFHFRLYSLE